MVCQKHSNTTVRLSEANETLGIGDQRRCFEIADDVRGAEVDLEFKAMASLVTLPLSSYLAIYTAAARHVQRDQVPKHLNWGGE